MQTAGEIYQKMDEAMPFDINNGPKPYIIEAMKLYAAEKVKEALRTAAANVGIVFIDGVTKEETIHGQIMSGADIIRPYRDGILSLETELIELINKES